ncbi:MAG: hypothetical protein NVSMB22_17420 [Chloroflexota bacterium]
MEERDSSRFGELLRRYRYDAGLTQEDLAKRALVSARAISDLERGVNRTARRDTVQQLVKALHLVPEQQAALEKVGHAPKEQMESGEREAVTESAQIRTFLIIDVRGYTRFTQEHGDEAGAALADRFAHLVQETVVPRQGSLVELRGDEALVVFSSARQALRSAVELRARFDQQRDQLPSLPLHVGIGVDAGEAVSVMGGYRGQALNLAARLCDLAGRHSSGRSEAFCTETVIALAGKMEGLAYVDRGDVHLKNIADPVRVIQIALDGELPDKLPQLQPIPVTTPINLPDEPTTFVGREREIHQIAGMLRNPNIRLLTLTGPGGIGKTRLAIRAAQLEAPAFEGGVFFVSLASVRDVDSVFHSIATALDLPEVHGQPSSTTVRNYLCDRHCLLVLDNFEQIVDAAPQLADLISQCPKLSVVVTSRVVLHVYGEHEYLVPPMSVPVLNGPVHPESLSHCESVRLFIDRVTMTQPAFRLTQENAESVAGICVRLDGLPLAIELAAARIKIFPPRVLLARLDHRLKLLTGGSRDLPLRQQTLRAAIAWSYDLLDESEQTLFRRLSVFVGGCTLEAAEAVCNARADLEIDVMEGLSSLVDKSLLQQQEGPGPGGYPDSRFSMLGIIREFALEQIDNSEEFDALQHRHAQYFLSLADRSYEMLMSPERDPWRAMWRVEWGNLRAMLNWSVETRHPEVSLPVAGYLWVWCWLDGPLEMCEWVDRLLAMPEAQEPTSARGWGLGAAASLAWHTGDLKRVPALGAMAVDIARMHNDKRLLSGALMLAVTPDTSARALLEESRALYREQGNVFGHGFAAVAAVRPLLSSGEQELLEDWLQEALTDFQRTGDLFGQALVLRAAGMLAVHAGDLQGGRSYLVEALERFRSMREKRYLPLVLLTLGGISRLLGDVDRAEAEFVEALAFVREYTARGNVASCIEGLAGVALERRQMERAVRLAGAAKRIRDSSNTVPFPMSEILNARTVEVGATSLDDQTFERLSAQGYSMTEEEAVNMALAPPFVDGQRAH